MITGDEIRRARERAGYSQEDLAAVLGVSVKTVNNWERGRTVSRNRTAVEDFLRAQLGDDAPAPLQAVSDVELLAEIARRLARGREREQAMGNDQHPTSIGSPRDFSRADVDVDAPGPPLPHGGRPKRQASKRDRSEPEA